MLYDSQRTRPTRTRPTSAWHRTRLAFSVLWLLLSPAASAQDPYPAPIGSELTYSGFTDYNGETFLSFSYHPDSASVAEYQSDDITNPGFGLAVLQKSPGFTSTSFIAPTSAVLSLAPGEDAALAHHEPTGTLYVAWEAYDTDAAEAGMYLRRYGPNGAPLDDGVRVSQTEPFHSSSPAVTVDADGEATVYWRGTGATHYVMRRVSVDGLPVGDEVAYQPAEEPYQRVAADADGHFVLVWRGTDADDFGIFARRFNAAGVAQGDAFRVNGYEAGRQDRPALDVAPDGTLAVAWSGPTAESEDLHGFVRLFNAQNEPLGAELLLGRSESHHGVAFFHTGSHSEAEAQAEAQAAAGDHQEPWRLAVAWREEQEIRGRYISTDGTAATPPTTWAEPLEFPLYPYNEIKLDSHGDNELMLLWTTHHDYRSGVGIWGRVLAVDEDGDDVPDPRDNCPGATNPGQWDWDDDGPGDFCDLCEGDDLTGDADGDGVCADRDCDPASSAAAYVDACGVCGGDGSACSLAQTVVDEAGDQARPDVAVGASGHTVVAWDSADAASGSDTDGLSVHARLYDRDGAPVGEPFQVNDYTTGQQLRPSVAVSPSGSFLVVWESDGSDTDTSEWSVQARAFDSAGVPLTGEILVNDWTTGAQTRARAAAHGGDEFLVTWSGETESDVTLWSSEIAAQRFDTAGQKIGTNLDVSGQDRFNQVWPTPASLPDGEFVIAWTSSDSGTYRIHHKRFDADAGELEHGISDEVHPPRAGHRLLPALAADPDGGFVVSWVSEFNDDSGTSVMAQRWAHELDSTESSFRLNAYTSMDQGFVDPVIVDGDLLTIWESAGSPHGPGDAYRIVARRWGGDDQVTSTAFQVSTGTGDQRSPRVARTPTDGFVVVWTDHDGPSSGIALRRYDGPGLHVDGFETGDLSGWPVQSP